MPAADGTQVWQFGAIEAEADGILKVGGMVDKEADAAKGSLTQLASLWGGASSDAWQQLQMRWDAKVNDVNQAVRGLANAVHESNMNMQQTESSVGARFV